MGEDEHKAAAKLAKRVCTYSIDVSIWYESTGYGLSSKQWWKLGLPNPANMGKPQEGRDSLPLVCSRFFCPAMVGRGLVRPLPTRLLTDLCCCFPRRYQGNSLENFLSVVAGDPKLVMADWLDASEVELNSPFVIRVSVWDTPDPERDCDKLRCGKEELAKFQASGSALRTRRLLTPVVVPDRQCHRELVRVSAGEPRWVQHDDGRGEVMEIPVTVGLCQGAAGPQALVDTFAEGGGAPAIVLALSLGSIPLHNSCSRELSLKPGMPKQIHVQGSLQSFVNGTSPGSISVYLCDDKGLPSSLGSNGIVRAGIWYSQDEVATTDVNINGGCTQVEIDLPEIFVRDLPPQGGEVSVTTEAFPLKRSRRNIDTSMVLSSANDLRVKISCSDRLTYLEVWQGGAAEPINKQLVPLTAAAGGEAVASSRCSILAGRQKEFATFYLRILRDGGAVVLVDDLKVWVENIKMVSIDRVMEPLGDRDAVSVAEQSRGCDPKCVFMRPEGGEDVESKLRGRRNCGSEEKAADG